MTAGFVRNQTVNPNKHTMKKSFYRIRVTILLAVYTRVFVPSTMRI